MAVTWETTTRRHGTLSGHQFHWLLGERPCAACLQAAADHERSRPKSSPERLQRLLIAKAQSRAKSELVRRHRDEYAELYAKHKVELMKEAD